MLWVVVGVVAFAFISLLALGGASRRDVDGKVKPPPLGKRQVLETLNAMAGFKPTKVIVKGGNPSGIAFDPESKQVIIVVAGKPVPKKLELTPVKFLTKKFDDILEASVVVDGETLTKTNRGSQLMGAATGALIAGGVGALVGGLSGSTTSKHVVRAVQVRILLNDLEYPSHTIDFIELTWSGATFPRVAIQEATELHDYLRIVMHQSQAGA